MLLRKLLPLTLIMIFLLACEEPQPRRPIQKKSGSFLETAVERNKKLLAAEETLIKNLIAEDTVNQYTTSTTGFWYYKDIENGEQTYYPQTDDEVLLRYNVLTLQGDTIYRSGEIGLVQHAVDKSQLFPGLRNAIKLLKEKERGVFLFPSSQAYGFKGDNNKIGPATPIKSTLEILKIKKRSDSLN